MCQTFFPSMSRVSLIWPFPSLVVPWLHAFAFKFPCHTSKSQALLLPTGCFPLLQNQAGENALLHQWCLIWSRMSRLQSLAGKVVPELQPVTWLSQRERKIWHLSSNGTNVDYPTNQLALMKGFARFPQQHHTTCSI